MSSRKLTLLSVVLCCASWAVAQSSPGGAPPAGGSSSAGQSSTPGSPATPPASTATPPPRRPVLLLHRPEPRLRKQFRGKQPLAPLRPVGLRTQPCRGRTHRALPPPEAPRNLQPSSPTQPIVLALRPP